MGWAAAIPAIFNQHQNDARRRLSAGASGLQAWGDPAGLFGGKGSIWDTDVGNEGPSINDIFNLNPGASTLKFLFGKAPKYATKYPDSPFIGLQDSISSLIDNGITFGQGGPNILSTIFGSPDQYMESFNKSIGDIDAAVNTMSLFNETGLPTDGTAYFNEAIRRLGTDIIPQLAETTGLGVQSGGYANQVARESANLLGQASLANIDLAEAATNRRQQAAAALATLAGARQSLPVNIASQLQSLFQTEQLLPLDIFQRLYSMGTQGPYAAPSYNPYDPTSAYLAAGQGITGILGALSNIDFGGSTGGPSTPAFETDFGGLYDSDMFSPDFQAPQ